MKDIKHFQIFGEIKMHFIDSNGCVKNESDYDIYDQGELKALTQEKIDTLCRLLDKGHVITQETLDKLPALYL